MPAITFARQLGSLGDEIAHAVAQELQVPFYDREVFAQAAHRLGISEAMARAEAAERPLVNRLVSVLTLRTPPGQNGGLDDQVASVDVKHVTSTGYRLVLEEVVRDLAASGRAIIIDHAAMAILHATPPVLHVFVHAGRVQRLERLVRARGVSHTEAARLIDASDAERAGYLLTEYGLTWDAPQHYGLVINTDRCSQAAAVAAIVGAARAMDVNRGQPDSEVYTRLHQEIYTVAEAAELFMIHPEVIRHAIFQGNLPAERIGHDTLLLHRHELSEWLQQQAAVV